MKREEFVQLDASFDGWAPFSKIVDKAVFALQSVELPHIPFLGISPRLYRLMQADAPRLGLNPLRMYCLRMEVCVDETLKPWEAIIFIRDSKGVQKIAARVVFNVLGLFPEMSGKEKPVITVNRLEKIQDEVTGVEGPGVSVVMEGPGGARGLCLSEETAAMLHEALKPLPALTLDAPEGK